jgi:hypothetical protein
VRVDDNHSANDRNYAPIHVVHLQAKIDGIQATTDRDVAGQLIDLTFENPRGSECGPSGGFASRFPLPASISLRQQRFGNAPDYTFAKILFDQG